MSVKDPKDPRKARAQSEPGFQEPTPKGAQESDSIDTDEDARAEEFEPPKEGDYSEDVASIQAESAPGGISRNLMEIKAQIENAIRQNAINGAMTAESALQG